MDQTPPRRQIGIDVSAPPPPEPPSVNTTWEHMADGVALDQPRVRVRSFVRELLETAIFILLIFFIVRGIVQNFKIEGTSMEPTMHTGEYILVNKLIYFHFDINAPLRLLPGQEALPQKIIYPFHQPRRGDIVVFEYPRDVSKDYIKRVIGLPGDTLEIRDGKVFLNGIELIEPYLDSSTACMGSRVCSNGPFVIPSGTIFVMGDNRNNSSDSREWDSLPLDRVVGQAWLIYYPINQWGLVPHHEY
ncbi:signal peptidase I [Oscillochloris trichoides DG-6]|uniref:Signal peptidase I n=1 Tax=Oscillochloris trichoides DG-6 TaxID=765420 RepID=E1IEQ2_9CHLR|nr:signal peptidase I [Oscillochloris trichoides]EFO80344.1 signal peptidase I [Oscillochloris trichoides DG-6]